MNYLLKNVTILDSKGAYHLQEVDVFISNGIIEKIGKNLDQAADKIIDKKGLHLSVGWFDSSVCFGEPGHEERETLRNGLKTASYSGFTDIALEPDLQPKVDSQSAVVHLKNYHSEYPTALHPIANFSKEGKGVHLSEFFDLQNNGAIGFGDFLRPIQNPELLKIALLYAQGIDSVILSTPQDDRIGGNGVAHEGETSTQLGLKGRPSLNEILQVQRDIQILDYSGGKLHIPCISTAEAVALVREAKKDGMNISCSVALANLCFTEESLFGFDTNFKLLPPLRTKRDCEALKEGLLDGTIDMVTSHHQPLNSELKKVEFEHAQPGTIGLEAMFGVLNTLFPLEKTIQYLTQGREIFGLKQPKIAEGEIANLTLFIPHSTSIFTSENIHSSSKNCAFIDHPTQGEVIGTIQQNKSLFK